MEKIQLTRALIFSAILIGKNKEYPNKLIELDKNIQTKIVNKFKGFVKI
jgi:hypothetical protein